MKFSKFDKIAISEMASTVVKNTDDIATMAKYLIIVLKADGYNSAEVRKRIVKFANYAVPDAQHADFVNTANYFLEQR